MPCSMTALSSGLWRDISTLRRSSSSRLTIVARPLTRTVLSTPGMKKISPTPGLCSTFR